MNSLQLLPESASSFASQYDLFFWMMVALCGGVATAIAIFVIYSAIRYHRKHENELPAQIQGNTKLEAAWTVIPLIIFLGMFAWGAKLYFDIERPPNDAIDVWVVGKQWMWKLQYPNGQREINELHVPVGQAVKLTMTSQDVIHSFFVPAFRIKQDVLPGRYTELWFRATKPGKYHLFCAEYCGAKHSGMIGWVYAMSPTDYSTGWSRGGAKGRSPRTGEKLFHQFGCANCHHFDDQGRCPNLRNLYGRRCGWPAATPSSPTTPTSASRSSTRRPKSWRVPADHADLRRPARPKSKYRADRLHRALGPPRADPPTSSGSAPRRGNTDRTGGPGSTSITENEPAKNMTPTQGRTQSATPNYLTEDGASSRGCSPPTTNASACSTCSPSRCSSSSADCSRC